ncbi:MAG: polysaccharide pyruvyl transferase family protein, partial [Bdellovibrionales bacterium]|nr:polysaccharide pyruvyl transferase family protein [Bdellovibrionales bacterium]
CLWKSDAALICDGIIFGKKFYNPAFNFLVTLGPLTPWMKLSGCKLICYSCGIGPFPSALSRVFAKYVIQSSDLILMRDQDSVDLSRELGVTKEISITGDAAFINSVSSDERSREIAREIGISFEKPILGVNVTTYMDTWLTQSERVSSRESFVTEFVDGIERFRSQQSVRPEVIFFSTQPMDEAFTREVAQRVGASVVDNTRYLSHDIQSVMRHCRVLAGMRFHSLVLSSAVQVPIVGLVYAPKVKGYMRLLGCEDFAVELGTLNSENFASTLSSAWENADSLRQRQQEKVSRLKVGAHEAATLLREAVFPGLQFETPIAAAG